MGTVWLALSPSSLVNIQKVDVHEEIHFKSRFSGVYYSSRLYKNRVGVHCALQAIS